MIFKAILLFFLIIAPLCTIAQKAYETANYSGKMKGQIIAFKLANGYVGASEISLTALPKTKPVLYTPDNGVPDDDNNLTFKSNKPTAGYFIIKNIKNAYDRLPAIIYGVFISANQSLSIKLTLDRNKI